ncbi:MAG: hypothetical protein RIQ94_3451, partial [Pseudomonadota bacterium]
MKENRIAVFVDAENVTNWIKQDGIKLLIEELMQSGQIIVRRAYGAWSRSELAKHQSAINQQGFKLVHCYHPITGKNTADIQMTMDVIECTWQLPTIDCFVLVTGDSDFSPVFRRLREMGKDVIGVGCHSILSECVKTSCSRFIYTDDYTECQQQLPAIATITTKTDIPVVDDVAQQIKDANAWIIHSLKDTQSAVNTSQFKSALIAKFASFDEKKLGFKTFSEFLTEITGVKLLKIGSANYVALEKLKPKIQTENQSQSSAEHYISLLNKHNMGLISVDKIKIIYEQSTLVKGTYIDLTSLKEAVYMGVNKIDEQLSKKDINKAFSIFLKISLIYNDKEKGGIGSVKVKKIDLKNLLLQIDKLIIT